MNKAFAKATDYSATPTISDVYATPAAADVAVAIAIPLVESDIHVCCVYCKTIVLSSPEFDDIFYMLVDANNLPVYDSDGKVIYVQR